jgi:hypothetical protein
VEYAFAKHVTLPAEFKDVQSGSPPAIPPMLRKPVHFPDAKRLTSVAPPVVNIEQTTPLWLSVVQLGAETAVVARVANAVHVVPLYVDHDRPPVAPRATHRTSSAGSSAQLGAE